MLIIDHVAKRKALAYIYLPISSNAKASRHVMNGYFLKPLSNSGFQWFPPMNTPQEETVASVG